MTYGGKVRETQGSKGDKILYRQRDARVQMHTEHNFKRDARVLEDPCNMGCWMVRTNVAKCIF